MVRAVADRWVPQLQEFSVDLAPGRDVVEKMLAPLADLKPVSLPIGPSIPCSICWQQRVVWEVGVLGLVPLQCERCSGSGWEPR